MFLAALAAAAALLARPVRPRLRDRLAPALRPSARRSRPSFGWLVPTAVAGVVAMVVAGPMAAVVAVAAGGMHAIRRRRLRPDDRADLPLVAELLAACLSAGTPMARALEAAAAGAGPALADACRGVATRLAAGVPPEQAWSAWLADPLTAPIARACVRGAETGAATATEIRRAAARLRVRSAADAAARVQRSGVLVVLPLGLCFLPAFVLVGVVPFALGLAGR